MSIIGAVLKRNVYVDQRFWKVFPNLNLMLIGPSGVGKDTVINQVKQVISEIGQPAIIGGKTIERVEADLFELGDPAVAYITASELTSFLGGKDYQESMTQELTDLLSNNPEKDISLKGDKKNPQLKDAFGKRIIRRPTITMHAGSTIDWLHKAMPEGSLEGGFLPRFLLLIEEYTGKHIPLVKYDISLDELNAAKHAWDSFIETVRSIYERYRKREQEIIFLNDAADLYRDWYCGRFEMYSKLVAPYANRSRDQVARLAMLSGISRGHNFIEACDVQFAVDVAGMVASRIDAAVKPPTKEAEVADAILRMLPADMPSILKLLSRQYTNRQITEAHKLLLDSRQIGVLNSKYYKL